MSYSPFYRHWIGRGITSPGVFQESRPSSSRAAVRSSTAQNRQGNLSPTQDHLSNLDSASLFDVGFQDKDRDASGYFSDILWGWLSFIDPPLSTENKPIVILAEGISQVALDRTPLVPCSPSPSDFITMRKPSPPSSSFLVHSCHSSLSPMDEALMLPSRTSDTRIDEADISHWILNDRYSSSSSAGSPPLSTSSPQRPLRPAALDDDDLQSVFGQWIELEESERRCRSEGEGEASNRASGSYGSFPRSTTAPLTLHVCSSDDEISDAFSSSMMRQREPKQDDIADIEDQEGVCVFHSDMQDMDFFDVWTPPPLHSPSSTSTMDHSFNLNLFSPIGKTELQDGSTVWDSSRSLPSQASDSPGFSSSSPFAGWSSVSPIDTKISALNLELSSPFDTIALHQPQPIRPIPPIPIPSSWTEESTEVDVTCSWPKDAINTRCTRSPFGNLSPRNSPISRVLSL